MMVSVMGSNSVTDNAICLTEMLFPIELQCVSFNIYKMLIYNLVYFWALIYFISVFSITKRITCGFNKHNLCQI